MKSTKPQQPKISLQGNITAKSTKLTIEVTDEDDPVSFLKLGKNSPKYSKFADSQKPSSKPLVPKTPAQTSIRKPLKDYNAQTRLFNFSSTPKTPNKNNQKSSRLITKRSNSKETPKNSVTPIQKKPAIESSRPNTTVPVQSFSKTEKPLNSLVTQVKSKNQFNFDIDAFEVQLKSEAIYREHLFQTFQAMKFIKTLGPVCLDQLKEKRVTLSRKKGLENRKTLIFDLDETLVHCCENADEGQVVLPIVFPSGEVVQAGINIRPYALDCLREVGKVFEVFVFTASHPCYANVVLDYLDPKNELIHQRFFRDSCVNMNGVFIKDLRIFTNRSLKDIIIVDNAAYSFAYQIENGIPIISWYNDVHDKELFNLVDYVKGLANIDDVREANDKTFHLKSFYEDYVEEFMGIEGKTLRGAKKYRLT